jgi:triosephosphate isomerase
MTRRIPLIAGNWKMHKTVAEARDLITALSHSALPDGVEVAICPPFTALAAASQILEGSHIHLGAQDMFWEPQGAFTGAVSPPMLVDLHCRYVIVGHSERRQHFGESDEMITRKVAAAFAHHLIPILCAGERLNEREAGKTEQVVSRQVQAATAELAVDRVRSLVIAYEPVWAIGTGRSATGEDANHVVAFIRQLLASRSGDAAASTRILYGGSVTPENAAEFSRQPEIDGALVGGASLDAGKFAAIIRAFAVTR